MARFRVDDRVVHTEWAEMGAGTVCQVYPPMPESGYRGGYAVRFDSFSTYASETDSHHCTDAVLRPAPTSPPRSLREVLAWLDS